MKLINRHPTTITITIAFITAALILLSHVSFSEQQQHSSSAESLSSDVDDDDHDQQHQHHHHVDLQPPEVPSSAEAAESAHSEEEDSNSFELPSLSSTESESPESAPFEAPPEEPPPPPPSFEAQQSGNDAKEEQKEPILSTQTAATSDQPPPPQQPSSEEQPPSSATFSDLLAQYTPSMEQSQQTVEAVKRNGLLAYDYLQSAVLHLATLVPSVLVDSHDDSTTKSESGNGPSGTSKRPRENYALLSRFSWSALCSYYESLSNLLELFCSTETAIAAGVLLLLIFLLIRYTVGRGRPPKEEEVSENCTDPLSPSSSSSTASQSASPASSGLFSRLLRFLNLTILFSNLTSYVDGAFRSFRSSEAVVTQTSHGHAGVYSMQGRRPNMEDCFTLRNNISRELGIDYYAVFDGHGGPNAALQAEREIFENISRRIRELVAGEANKENNSSSQEQQLSKSKSVPSSPTKPTSSSSSSEGSCPATPSTPSTSSSPLTFSSMLNSGKALANNLNSSHNNLRPFDSLTVNAMKTILHEEITAVDAKLVEAFRRRGDISGTTAVIAVRLVHSNLLLVANVGDSRAVLCDWKGQAIVLSVDHKPYQLKEYRRIVEAGGYIMLKGVYRVNGILAVSRALGDYPLKEDRLVIADPDILSFDLTELRARFMIIASDGFFDCFSNENAVQFVRGELARHGTVNMGESQAGLALYLAKRLANEAYTRESYDNITIIVVLFEDVSGGGVQVKGVGQATCSSGGSSPTTKTAPTPLPTTTSPKTSTSTTTT